MKPLLTSRNGKDALELVHENLPDIVLSGLDYSPEIKGIVAREEGVFPVQGDGADRAFDGVAVDLDAAIGEEAAKAVAVFGDVGQGLAQG